MSETKTTPASIIELLVNCVNQGDTGAFYTWAERYRDGLSPTGDAYQRIARHLAARPQHMKLLDGLSDPKSKVKGLVSFEQPAVENVFVGEAVRAFLNPLLIEWGHRDLYAYHRIGVRTKLLLHGSTGNGKTTLARYLARQANLPLVVVETDFVIESKLGRTSNHINAVFNSIKEPCLLFWDEVDSVGRRRGGAKGEDSGVQLENERMVNSMLTNLEKLDPAVVFVAATNRREILDTAILRRFDAQFEVPAPTAAEKMAYAQQLMDFHQLESHFALDSLEGLASYSAVRLAVLARARAYIAAEITRRIKL